MNRRANLILSAVMLSSFVALPVCAVAIVPRAAPAVAPPPGGPIVLVDLVPADAEHPVATRIFSFTAQDDDPLVLQLLGMLSSLRPADSIAGTGRILRFIRDRGEDLAAHSSNRWVSHQGDSVQVIVLRPAGELPDMNIEEKSRHSRLTADLDSLIELAGAIANKQPGMKGRDAFSFTLRKYRLRNTRATLKIEAHFNTPDSARDATNPPQPVSTTLVTGPSERLFLSANAAFTKLRQVRYNASEKTFEPGNKPTEFLLGLNYSMQDLFQNDNATGLRAFVKGIYLGLLVEPSRRPFNQIAATVGFRHSPPPFESVFSLETVSPYIGFAWARDDVPGDSAPSRVENRYGRPSLIMGLALGLDKALGWLGGAQ